MEQGEWEPEFPWKDAVRAATTGVRWRIYASILLPIAWAVVMLVFAVFWSGGLTLFQNVAIFLTSLVAIAGVIGILWISMGIQFVRRL